MRVIGITGGVGSGKSKVLKLLKSEYHADIIQADEVAKELEEPGEEGYEKLMDALGTSILDAAGRIDRRYLAELIFNRQDIREAVNAIIHPLTWKRIRQRIRASESELVVVESALLDEAADEIYDELWYIYAAKELRIQRLARTRGYSRERSLAIMEAQASDEEFCQAADWMIDNSGSIEDLKHQLEKRLNR